MKIRTLSAHPLCHTLREPFAYAGKWIRQRTALLVKVETDSGLTGWGEVFCADAWPALATLIERVFEPLLVGEEALAIAVVWDKLYSWTRDYGQKGLTTAAISGIDIALWDILGQATGQPVSVLLGGAFRNRVRCYATGLYRTRASMEFPVVLAREASSYVAQGFTAVKMKVGFGLERDIRAVAAVREAIGDGIDLMVDANHALDVPRAIALGQAIAPQRIAWFEEPVVPENLEGYRAVRQALPMPIAGGEAEFTRYGFRELVSRGAVDIAQPDISLAGGISETLKIAALCQAWHVRCLPHVWGTGVALAAALHLLAALPDEPASLTPALPLLEYDRTENPLREETLTSPIPLVDGCLLVPQGPGLGVQVDERALERFRAE